MRFYELTLTEPGATKPSRTWTTHPNGTWDPNALLCEFDAFTTPYASPVGSSTVTLHGIGLGDLKQTQQFGQHHDSQGNMQPGMTLELRGGMGKGLPLANPAQAGTLLVGEVIQCFGNWQQTDMRLDFVVVASPFTIGRPGNFVLDWRRGQKLSDALRQCLGTAFPGKIVEIDISDQIVASEDAPHVASTLESLAQTIEETTKSYLGPSYPGVSITVDAGVVKAFDGSGQPSVIQLNFVDLVGQPVWIGVNSISITAVLRGDVRVGDVVSMPQGMQSAPGFVAMMKEASPSMLDYVPTFQGKFWVREVRHIGNSRAPDGRSWVTVLVCTPQIGATNG